VAVPNEEPRLLEYQDLDSIPIHVQKEVRLNCRSICIALHVSNLSIYIFLYVYTQYLHVREWVRGRGAASESSSDV
jgi:hypothetical protein